MQTLHGKTCLITGASSGLGLATTELFAKNGASVVMLCRNTDKAHTAVEGILRRNSSASVLIERCDLSSLDSLRSFIANFTKTHTSLDILCNNAATMKAAYSETPDGLESMFQTNYIAPLILTESLLDLLKKAASPRIINITLPPTKLRLDFSDLQSRKDFNTVQAFFRTKLALLLHSLELADGQIGENISVVCADPGPGPFHSELAREMPALMRLFKKLISRRVDNAAANILYYATQDLSENGSIFKGTRRQEKIPYWNNRRLREELRRKTEELLVN